MKLKLTVLAILTWSIAISQKQTINTELVSEIISAKQEELKVRVLSNIVVKNIRTTNYTTYNTIYNLVDIVTSEKNKTVMTQSLLKKIADYSITYLLTNDFLDTYYGEGIEKYMTAEFKEEEKQELFQSQKQQSQTKVSDKTKIDKSLLGNFIMDTLYKVLSQQTELTSRGFFKLDPSKKYFESGLAIDYNKIRNDNALLTVIKGNLNTYISNLTSKINNGVDVYKFIKEADFKFKDIDVTKKQNVAKLLELFSKSLEVFREQIGKNSFVATIGDLITKYVIFDASENEAKERVYNFKIDVEAIVLAFEDKFYHVEISSIRKHFIGIKPFLTIGFNYGYFTNKNNSFIVDNSAKSLYQIALAGEKIGLKFTLFDFKYSHSFTALEWYQYRGSYRQWTSPQPKPLINNIYGFIYGSGLIYNIVNLKTEKNFNSMLTGIGFGIEFFNGLETNLSYAIPLTAKDNFKEMNEKSFINFGVDIPIFEYLRAARGKNK